MEELPDIINYYENEIAKAVRSSGYTGTPSPFLLGVNNDGAIPLHNLRVYAAKGQMLPFNYTFYISSSVGSVQLTPFPNFCAALIISGISSHCSKSGVGSLLLEFSMDIAAYQGYTNVYATNTDRSYFSRTLEKFGFKKIESYKNHRTSNPVSLFSACVLDREPKKLKKESINYDPSTMEFVLI